MQIVCITHPLECSVGIMSSEGGLVNVDVIVLDEVHYLSDISRGTVWEEIVRLFPCLKFVRSLNPWVWSNSNCV